MSGDWLALKHNMQVNHLFRFNSDSRVYLEGGGLKELFLDESDAPCIKNLSCSSSVKTVVVLSGVVHSNYKFLLSYKEYYFFLVDGKCRIYHTDKGLVNECGLGMIWFHSGNEPYLICDTPNDGTITVSTIEGEVFGNYHMFNHQSEESINNRNENCACSANCFVLKFIGNWFILKKKSHDSLSATIKAIGNDIHGNVNITNDVFFIENYGWKIHLYDLDGDYIGEHLKNAATHYCLYPKTIDSRTYYGVLRIDDYAIIIPPIYEKMDYLLYRDDILFKVIMRDTLNNKDIEGILSAEHGLVVPFGCKYYFATYNNTYYINPFKITSDSYLIYELGGYKGLVFHGKNVLGAEYDDILGFDYSFDLGERDEEDYLTLGITAQWAPNCVILKKGNHYGLFIDERNIILPIYESLDFVKCSNSVYYFIAEMKGMRYLINTLDGVLLSVPSDYSYVSSGQNKYTEIFVFKSKETEKYLFVDYIGNPLIYNNKKDKLINVQWHSKQFGYDVDKEGFKCQVRRSSDYDDGGYNQDELNDMYKDAFDNNPEYKSNID